MEDFLGNDLTLGDSVVYLHSGWSYKLDKGAVIDVLSEEEGKIRVSYEAYGAQRTEVILSKDCVVIQ